MDTIVDHGISLRFYDLSQRGTDDLILTIQYESDVLKKIHSIHSIKEGTT